jgi:hypothetical protein
MALDHDLAARAAVAERAETFVGRLEERLRIPSIGADPARADDVRHSAGPFPWDDLAGTTAR